MVVNTNKFQKTLNADDFNLDADVSLPAGKWTLIAEYTVPAQQEVSIGATEIINGGQTGRPAYIRMDSTSGQIKLKMRTKVVDANDQGQVINEHSYNEWSASKTSRTDALLLQEDSRRAQEDSKLQIWGYTDSDSTIDYDDADTEIQLPVTVYTIKR